MTGWLVIMLSLSMIFSLICGLLYREPAMYIILKSMIAGLAGGAVMVLIGKGLKIKDLSRREGMAFVAIGWFAGAFVCCLPFLMCGPEMGFHCLADAYFEAMSGLTTTGASILKDVEKLPRCILFWRSFTHWLGGMGIIVLFICLMPFLGVAGRHMFKSEVPGPMADMLRPKIMQTARVLWTIYSAISIALVFLLMLCGMDLFDALCHMFGTMATGGYSTRNASIGHYQSVAIEYVIILFMIIAGTNFSLYHLAVQGRLKKALADRELHVYLGVIFGATALITASVMYHNHYDSIFEAFRAVLFQVSSLMTTTGYATADYDKWPPVARVILLILMFVGGCAGSTGGGMKVIRILVVAKYMRQTLFNIVHPEAVLGLRVGSALISRDTLRQITGFFILAIGVYVGGVIIVAAFGYDLLTSISAVAATLWNVGPGLELIGPTCNYSFFHPLIKCFLSFLMAVGRLEFFTVLIIFMPAFWKK